MKHTLSKPVKVYFTVQGKVIELSLQPVTFQRLIDITGALEIDMKEQAFEKILLNPTPMQIVTIVYCMLDKSSKELIDKISLEIGDEKKDVDQITKLYYLIAENNIKDGYINYNSLITGVNKNIIDSFPQEYIKKKRIHQIAIYMNHMILKKYMILSAIIIVILIGSFWMNLHLEQLQDLLK